MRGGRLELLRQDVVNISIFILLMPQKNTIRNGFSTALYTVYTVYNVLHCLHCLLTRSQNFDPIVLPCSTRDGIKVRTVKETKGESLEPGGTG